MILAPAILAAVVATADTTAPNILLIVADDFGVDMVNAYGVGTDLPPTPVIDSLAENGVLFRNVWSSPVCSPTRATIQTGRYTFRNGIGDIEWQEPLPLPWDEITIPEMLDLGAGGRYEHSLIGKWHLGQRDSVGGIAYPNLAGYQHFAGVMENFAPPDTFYSYEKVVDGVASVHNEYATVDQVDSALEWIGQTTGPWFCCLNFSAPHNPFHAPPAELHTQDLTGAGDPAIDSRPYFKAMVEAMDTEMGRLFTELDDVLDNTVVLFVGDNGTPGVVIEPPFDSARAKGTVYEGGIKVPLIVSGPNVMTGQECNALVHTADIFATIAELVTADLGLVLPADTVLDSVSFAPYLTNPALPSLRSSMFTERFYPTGVEHALEPPITTFGDCDCQEDIGYSGPGNAVLSLCGDLNDELNPAYYLLANAPPNAPVVMYWSPLFTPTSMNGGTVTPFPPAFLTNHTTDSNGQAVIPNFAKFLTVYAQAVIEDLSQPEGSVISNTVQAVYPTNVKAIRNQQYKLIRYFDGSGPDEFYDLQADPFETTNLLGLIATTTEDMLNYRQLKREMRELLYNTNARDRTPPPPPSENQSYVDDCPPGR